MDARRWTGAKVVRRQLGRKLRRLREEANKTHADVENAQIAGPTKMWRIENGKVAVKPGDVWALCRLYNVGPEATDLLVDLASGTSQAGWWEQFPSKVVPEWLGLYSGLEAGSSRIKAFHPAVVLGFLQTPDYARAIISIDDQLDEEAIQQRVKFRMARQHAVLTDHAFGRVHAILGAGALSLAVGSEDVMKEQVEHLLLISAQGRAVIRVLPWSAGAHPSLNGAFTLLDFDDEEDPELVHVETHLGAKYLELPAEVRRFQKIFTRLDDKSIPIEEYMA